jgi:hypothetical protein
LRFAVRRAVITLSVEDAVVLTVTPVGLKLIVSPFADGEMLEEKATNPLKPFAAVTVTVYAVDDPRETVREGGVTARLKSGDGGGAVGVAETSLESAPVPALLIAATS